VDPVPTAVIPAYPIIESSFHVIERYFQVDRRISSHQNNFHVLFQLVRSSVLELLHVNRVIQDVETMLQEDVHSDEIARSEEDSGLAHQADRHPIEPFFAIWLREDGRPPSLEDVERFYVARMLEHLEGRRMQAALALGISYPTFLKRLRELGIVSHEAALKRASTG
jgi:DNA-binding NtrC family response regulator